MVSSAIQPEVTNWLSYFQSAESFTNAVKYDFPHGHLFVSQASIELEIQGSIKKKRIASACNKAIKKALQQQKRWLKSVDDEAEQDSDSETRQVYSVLILDVILTKDNKRKRVTPNFGARYFIEDFVMEVTEQSQVIQVFSHSIWLEMLEVLQTPCELWRFLAFHLTHLQKAAKTGEVTFASERSLITDFLESSVLFTQAIEVDKALVKYKLRTEPNPILLALEATQNEQNTETEIISYEHMRQASTLWTHLYQCAHLNSSEAQQLSESEENEQEQALHSSPLWMRQLLDESLFSRYELVRELYLYPNQSEEVKHNGYVVHQHSYESLGRHYVLIFYGTQDNNPHARATLQPRLQDVAKDVANRLILPELHHVVILGIEFLNINNEVLVDMDVFIQSIGAMTEKERYLAEQLSVLRTRQQSLSGVQRPATTIVTQVTNDSLNKLPSLKLKMKM